MIAYLLSPNRYHWLIAQVKNYNLDVTEARDSDFKKSFPGIFNFTVGILAWSQVSTNLAVEHFKFESRISVTFKL